MKRLDGGNTLDTIAERLAAGHPDNRKMLEAITLVSRLRRVLRAAEHIKDCIKDKVIEAKDDDSITALEELTASVEALIGPELYKSSVTSSLVSTRGPEYVDTLKTPPKAPVSSYGYGSSYGSSYTPSSYTPGGSSYTPNSSYTPKSTYTPNSTYKAPPMTPASATTSSTGTKAHTANPIPKALPPKTTDIKPALKPGEFGIDREHHVFKMGENGDRLYWDHKAGGDGDWTSKVWVEVGGEIEILEEDFVEETTKPNVPAPIVPTPMGLLPKKPRDEFN